MTSAMVNAPAYPEARADYAIEIAPYSLEVSPRRAVKTVAYNSQVPGPLLRFQEGRPVTIQVTNRYEKSGSGALAWSVSTV